MAKNTLIKCIVNGKELRSFNFEALTGEFFTRLLKLPNIKSIEVSDPTLEDKLTKDEFTQLAKKFEYLAPKVRKPEPLPLEEIVATQIQEQKEEFETLIQPVKKKESAMQYEAMPVLIAEENEDDFVVNEGDEIAGNLPITIEIKEVSELELKPKQTRNRRTNAN